MVILRWFLYIYFGGVIIVMTIWIVALLLFLTIGLSNICLGSFGLREYKNLTLWVLRGLYDFFINALQWPRNVPLNIYDYCRARSVQPRE